MKKLFKVSALVLYFAAILCVIYIYVIFSLISSVNVITGIIHQEMMLWKSWM